MPLNQRPSASTGNLFGEPEPQKASTARPSPRVTAHNSDSELLVRQLKGIYKVNNLGLKPLYQRAQSLIRNLDNFRIDHVRREQNKEADRLANLAMDEKKL
jgi:ribonuclease HI